MTESVATTARALHLLIRVVLICTSVELTQHMTRAARPYAMYVWTDGFDVDVPGCSEVFLLWDKGSYSQCFTHTWETAEKRQWLWDVIWLEGRVIDTLYVSDMHHRLRAAYDSDDCNSAGLDPLRSLLDAADCRNVQIYALFAVSDRAVSEKGLVKYVVWYNDHCAGNRTKFTGVAVNNEAFMSLKCNDEAAQVQHLTDLADVALEAAKQVTGILKTHFSMSWHWGRCSKVLDNMLAWNGKNAKATEHMIDIFDSTDVQVAWTRADTIVNRLIVAGVNYAKSVDKPMYVTVYTNKGSVCRIQPMDISSCIFAQPIHIAKLHPHFALVVIDRSLTINFQKAIQGSVCRSTFFPQSCGTFSHNPTQAGMFAVFDDVDANPYGQYAHPCIHYFRGVYGSGAHDDWPSHRLCHLV